MMTIRLTVSNFTKDGRFWASKPEEVHQLTEVEPANLEECEKKDLCEGDLCLVSCDAGTWKRGKIISLLAGQHEMRAEVFLIDRAIKASISLRSCHPLSDALKKIPPLASLYRLKGLQPSTLPSGQWNELVMDLLTELNGGHSLEAEVEANDFATLYWMVGDVKVNFNECLLHANLATVCKVQEPPEGSIPTLCVPIENEKLEVGDIKIEPIVTSREVYVEGGPSHSTWNSLEMSPIPPSVQKGLLSLGFKLPTLTQANTWPYVWDGYNVVLISPSGTGKTLSFLLPLLADVGIYTSKAIGPLLLIVVGSSWQAKSIQIQSKRILSWMSAEKSLRCCCTYKGVEAQATATLINGVDVVAGTPPSILRLIQRGTLSLKAVSKLVLDGVADLQCKYNSEIHKILSLCGGVSQVVLTSQEWSPSVNSLMSVYTDQPVLILVSAVEALIRAGTSMTVVYSSSEERFSSVIEYLTKRPTVVCTSSPEEASKVQQIAQLNNLPCLNIVNHLESDRIQQLLSNLGLIVVSDKMLNVALREQLSVSHLLHFSLPQSKHCFQRRLSLLFPSLARGDKGQCTVVVTEADSSRCAMFVDFLKRTSQPIPKAVQEIADIFLMEKEKLRSTYDICYHLKAWGACGISNCPSLHKPPKYLKPCEKAPPPLTLPSCGAVEVKVCHVSNATRLWVTMLKHYPEARGGQSVAGHDPAQLVALTLNLAQHYSDTDNRVLAESVHEGMYCGLEDVDGSYLRVRVLKFSKPLGFCFPHKEKARIRLIDYGRILIVDLNQLLILPEKFLALPAQVAEVFLCGVRPVELDRDWSEEAIELCRNMLNGEVLYGEIAAYVGQTLWLNPVEQRVSLSGIKVNTALCNPTQELVKAGFAERNEVHLSRLKDTLILPSHTELKTGKIRWSSLDDAAEVHISAVYSPTNFHVQMTKNHPELDQLEQVLNTSHVNTIPKSNLHKGDLCSAQFPLDDMWYRGLIHSRTEEQSEIIFIDYGDCEWVPNHKVQPIDTALLELPAQAIKCSLVTDFMSWPNNSGDILWDMTRGTNLTARVAGVDSEGAILVEPTFPNSKKSVCECLLERLDKAVQTPPTGLISEAVAAIVSLGSEQVQFAKIIESLMVRNPMYVAKNFLELSPLFENMHKLEDAACLHILKGVSVSIRCFTDSLFSIDWMMGLLQRENMQVVEATIHTIKLLLSVSPSFRLGGDVVCCLVSLLNSSPLDASLADHIFDCLLLCRDCMGILDLAQLAQVCCSCALREGVSEPCLHLLDVLAADQQSAHTVRRLLSIQALESDQFWSKIAINKHGSLLVNVLWNLSSDQSYRDELRECSLLEKFQCGDNFLVVLLCTAFNLPFEFVNKAKRFQDFQSYKSHNRESIVCPRVLWSQQKSSVLLAIQLRECLYENVDVKFGIQTVSFRAHFNRQIYGFSLTLSDKIAVEECGFLLTASEVLISLRKESLKWWPTLTNKTSKLPMFSVDFNRCYTSSSDEEESTKKNTVIRQQASYSESSSEHAYSSGPDPDLGFDFPDFGF